MKYIITENQYYFLRRNIDFRKILFGIIEKTPPCKYKKLVTYLNTLIEKLVVYILSTNETFRDEFLSDDKFENEIKEIIFEEYFEFIISYYRMKCGTDLKF